MFRLERRTSADRQFEGQSTTRDEWLEEGRWRARPDNRWLTELTARLGQSNANQSVEGFAPVGRRLIAQSLAVEITYLPSPVWRFGVVTSFDQADLEDDGDVASRVAGGPHVVYQKGGRFRSELLMRGALIEGGAVPVLVPSGFPVFPDRFDYTLRRASGSGSANLVLSANGHQRGGARLKSGRVELRAYLMARRLFAGSRVRSSCAHHRARGPGRDDTQLAGRRTARRALPGPARRACIGSRARARRGEGPPARLLAVARRRARRAGARAGGWLVAKIDLTARCRGSRADLVSARAPARATCWEGDGTA